MPPPAEPSQPGPTPTALLVLVLEWFQDPALAECLSRRHWRRLESRCEIAVGNVLELLARHGAKATFAVLGAIAERQPGLLRRIVAAGHEVTSLGQEPVALEATPVAERPRALAELQRARAALEAAAGTRVVGFCPAWPGRGADAWWRAPLQAEGYAYEASDAGALPAGRSALGAVRVHHRGGAVVTATSVSAFAFDAAAPRLVGLPRGVVAAHYGRSAQVRTQFAEVLACGAGVSIATALGVPIAPAPLPVPAPPPATVPVARDPRPLPDVPRLAVIVPLKDEEDGLPSLALELAALRTELEATAALEFVFVDDGSTDRTWPLMQELFAGLPHARLCRHAQNRGVAAAIQTGMRATDAAFVASIDGDLSYDPVELARMLPLLDGADLVTASPYHPDGGVKNVPPWRLCLSRTLSACYRRLLRSDVRTWTSCFRVYRRAAVVDLPVEHPGFLGTAELLVRVLRRGGRVREHPCVLEARLFGVSKLKVLRTIRGHLRLLWQVLRGQVR